jgi:2-polyprenyl-3-methyl-5-hydroxy-6-metoxy-1,4-benzoquinol methylase
VHPQHEHAHDGTRLDGRDRATATTPTYTQPADTTPRLADFLDRFRDPALAATIAKQTGEALVDVDAKLARYRNEATQGWRVASRVLQPGARVLEIGAGLGFVSLFLRNEGYDVVALEPVNPGFGFFAAAQPVVRAAAADIDLEGIAIGVEALSPQQHGRFDVIFSANVLEHVDDLAGAFRGMASVLAPDGAMAHMCPNYHVPYEPHLGIPLLPGAPAATRHLFKGAVSRNAELWHTLNFVTSSTVRKLARTNGLRVEFERAMMYEFVQRLGDDPEFAGRHDSAAMRALQALQRRNALAFLRHLPPALATPMLFTLRASA